MTGGQEQERGQGFTAEERESLELLAKVIGPWNAHEQLRITAGREPTDTLSLAINEPSPLHGIWRLRGIMSISVADLLLVCRAIDVALAPAPAQEGKPCNE